MVENIGTIKNPLTIIAIFAGISEISGTVVLPFITAENQAVFVWFLIVFPVVLIVLFFLTLNFNNTVLYAPSDYKNEGDFRDINLPRATIEEKNKKIDEEITEQNTDSNARNSTKGNSEKENVRTRFLKVENIALQKIENEFIGKLERDVKIGNFIFDAIVRNNKTITAIEVKHINFKLYSIEKTGAVVGTISQMINSLVSIDNGLSNCRIVIVFVSDTECTIGVKKLIQEAISKAFDNKFSFPIEIRFYNMQTLQAEGYSIEN